MRPFQLRRTRAALKRRNVFDTSIDMPRVPPVSVPRELALLAAPLLAPSHRLPAPAGVVSECAEGLLTTVLPILLAVGRLSESNTALRT